MGRYIVSAGSSYNINIYTMLNGFFDRRRVIDALEKRQHRFLNSWGSYVMHDIRRLLKYRENEVHSQAGMSPFVHYTGVDNGLSPLRSKTLYAYDAKNRSVVVGPARLEIPTNPDGKPAPQTLEEGGMVHVVLMEVALNHTHVWMTSDLYALKIKKGVFAGKILNTVKRKMTMEPRPYVKKGSKRHFQPQKIKQLWDKINRGG